MLNTEFGASVAGYRVVQMLGSVDSYKGKRIRKRICHFFNAFCVGINEIYRINNTRFVLRVGDLWLKDHIAKTRDMKEYPKELCDYLRDSIIARHRNFIREYSIEMDIGSLKQRTEMQKTLFRHKRRFWDLVYAEEHGQNYCDLMYINREP